MDEYSKKRRLITGGTALVLVLISVCAIIGLSVYQKNNRIRNAKYVMMGEINKLQYEIDSRLFNTKTLEAIVVNNDGEIRNFDKIAEDLYVNDPSIRSLQLAPDGVVSYIYPLEGNEEGFGDLFSDPERKTEAEYARDTGKMTLAGPFELNQGGMGMVARNPIYLTDNSGQRTFWGFSIVILNVPEIFDKGNLESLDGQGYYYKVWRIDPSTKKEQEIIQNAEFSKKDVVEDEIKVPNGTWTLSMIPKEGWIPINYVVIECIVCCIIIILTAMVLNGLLTSTGQKKELAKLVNLDPLTGLYNERYFLSCLKNFVQRKQPCVLYYLDMNRFKQINDRFGHDIGDKVLIEFAGRVRRCVGNHDLSFRIGGDEFTVLAPEGASKESCDKIKARLKEEIGRPFVIPECTLHPSVSIGYARYPEEQKNVEALIRHADQEMYEEKRTEILERSVLQKHTVI